MQLLRLIIALLVSSASGYVLQPGSGFALQSSMRGTASLGRATPAMGIRERAGKLLSRFRRRDQTEDVPTAVPTAEPSLPPPIAVTIVEPEECIPDEPETCEPQMVLSSTDKMLVKLGMKTEDECELQPEGENLMEQIKCAGRAGIISYILWEWAFWIGAGGVATFTYYTATGGWPDLSNPDDQGKVAASAFALVNVARFAVPLRIGLALGSVPWVDDNIVKPFLEKEGDKATEEM